MTELHLASEAPVRRQVQPPELALEAALRDLERELGKLTIAQCIEVERIFAEFYDKTHDDFENWEC